VENSLKNFNLKFEDVPGIIKENSEIKAYLKSKGIIEDNGNINA